MDKKVLIGVGAVAVVVVHRPARPAHEAPHVPAAARALVLSAGETNAADEKQAFTDPYRPPQNGQVSSNHLPHGCQGPSPDGRSGCHTDTRGTNKPPLRYVMRRSERDHRRYHREIKPGVSIFTNVTGVGSRYSGCDERLHTQPDGPLPDPGIC